MASGTMNASSDLTDGTDRAPNADGDERIRVLIRAELDRRYASKIARRTLELLAEAATEPTDEGPGYRIVDRSGQTRYHQGSEPGSRNGAVPMTLGDLVDELRERYPDLFSKPPEPERAPAPREAEPDHDTMADVRAAGARFVGQQTALAKSLATNSAERGRVLADRMTGRFEGLRARFGGSRKAQASDALVAGSEAAIARPDAAGSPAFAQAPAMTQVPAPREIGGRMREGLQRLSAGFRSGRDSPRRDTSRRGLILVGLGTVLVVALLTTFLVLRREASPPTTDPQVAESNKTGTKAPTSGPQTSEPGAKTPAAGESEEAADDPAQNPNALKGVPEVIDTATLRVAGKLVRLFGVEWVRGAQGQDLTRYLSGRTVACLPAPGSTAFTCTVEGRDLSEVVLFNGGGRASSEAAPEHVAAEEHARSERLGVWKR